MRLVLKSRTPLSIKIAVALFAIAAVAFLWPGLTDLSRALPVNRPRSFAVALAWLAVAVALPLWGAIATLRLSRWPLLVLLFWIVGAVALSLRGHAGSPNVTVLLNVAPWTLGWTLLAALVAPHWRVMSCSLFGRLPPQPEPAAVFDLASDRRS